MGRLAEQIAKKVLSETLNGPYNGKTCTQSLVRTVLTPLDAADNTEE